MDKKLDLQGMAASAAIILLMIGAASLFHEPEIIFPEIAALCTGVFLTPKVLWKDTGPVKLLALMTISAIFGVGLAALVPSLYLRIVLGGVFTLVCLAISGCALWPMLSACILPALLSITSPVYPVSVFACTLAIVLVKQVAGGFRTVASDREYRSSKLLRRWGEGMLLVLIYALPACLLDRPLLIVPPLFVLFMELYTDEEKLKGREAQVLILGIACCNVGALLAMLLQYRMGGGPLLAGAVIAPVLFLLFHTFDIYLPPMAALSYLPLILPAEALPMYPVFTGMTLLVITLVIRSVRQEGKRQKR